jgi:hypothetical protein
MEVRLNVSPHSAVIGAKDVRILITRHPERTSLKAATTLSAAEFQ